jgi:hypothetical protein
MFFTSFMFFMSFFWCSDAQIQSTEAVLIRSQPPE